MNTCFLLICVVLGLVDNQKLHPRLRTLLDSGPEKTSEIQWTLTWIGSYDDGLIERHITRTTGDTVWESNLGNEKGEHRTRFKTRPPGDATPEQLELATWPRSEDAGVHHRLKQDGRIWHINRGPVASSGYAIPTDKAISRIPMKVEAAGLAPRIASEVEPPPFNLHPTEFEGFENVEFTEGRENGFPSVVATWSKYELNWLFDDRQGGLPIRASYYQADHLRYYSITKNEQVAGRWLPKSVEYFRGDSQTPYCRLDVQTATYDKPEHMQEITPNDIGALPGTQFIADNGLHWWTGGELLHEDEYLPLLWLDPMIMDDRIAQTMAEGSGQTVEEYRARLRQSGDALRERYKREYGEELKVKKVDEEDPWVVYTNTFVKKHEFDEAAEKRARVTCDRAISLRDSLKLRDAAKIREAKREGNKRKLDEIEEREKKVFERMLVKPLDKMLATLEKKKETSAKGG